MAINRLPDVAPAGQHQGLHWPVSLYSDNICSDTSQFTHRPFTGSMHNQNDHKHHDNGVVSNDPAATSHTTDDAPSPAAPKKARLQPPNAVKNVVLEKHPGFNWVLPEVSVTAQVRGFFDVHGCHVLKQATSCPSCQLLNRPFVINMYVSLSMHRWPCVNHSTVLWTLPQRRRYVSMWLLSSCHVSGAFPRPQGNHRSCTGTVDIQVHSVPLANQEDCQKPSSAVLGMS